MSLPNPPESDDDALILWMLTLTPTQRLEVAQGFVDSVKALVEGVRGDDSGVRHDLLAQDPGVDEPGRS